MGCKVTEKCRQGWRYFTCEDCRYSWRETCRDANSPSGVDCLRCHTHIPPERFVIDATVKVDRMGNLVDDWFEPVDS